ncbi:MFS transporter [Pyrococcus kukulkanii]|uniref:MFS transporter n=1 Tax=Pyrococcus kukulkanii TaxID=1609559 RepID=UPI003563B898
MPALGRDFWLFAIGRFISQVGWAVQEVALPLYVLDVTHSAKIMTLFVLADLIPSLLTMPIAGVIGDRYNRKALMVGLDLARGALLFGVVAFNFLGIKELLAVQVVLAIMSSFFSAGTSAMYPDLVRQEDLERANSIVMSAGIVARLIGPALGGFIYAFGGIKLAILVNAVSFFGSGLFEVFIRYEWKSRKIENLSEVIEDLVEGIRFIRSNRYLMVLVTFALAMNAFGNPFGAVIWPYSLREVLKFSSQQFGIVESSFMLGALFGNLLIAAILGRKTGRHIFKLMLVNGMLLLPFIWIISPYSTIPRDIAFYVLIGMGIGMGMSNAMINVPINSNLQRAVPTEFRGRVFSALGVLANLTVPIGLVVVGPLIDHLGAWKVSALLWIGMGAVVLYYWLFHRDVLTNHEPSPQEHQ